MLIQEGHISLEHGTYMKFIIASRGLQITADDVTPKPARSKEATFQA